MPVEYGGWQIGGGSLPNGWVDLGNYYYSPTFTSTTTGTYVWPTTTTSSSTLTWTGTVTFPRATTPPSPQVRILTDAEAIEADRAAHQRAASRTQAISRAEELLLSMLNPEQVASYTEQGHFDVIGSEGGRYRIEKGVSGNVLWIPEGSDRMAGRLCAHPSMRDGWLPTPDVAVAQLLALQTNEREFVGVANLHHGQRPAHLVAA